jgi:hypothetical protein
MNVLFNLGLFWSFYGIAGLLGWQLINNKFKGYDWTKQYIRCQGISWLMLGIPCIVFERVFAASDKSVFLFVLLFICLLPSLIFSIVIDKKYSAKIKDTQNSPR